MFFALLIGIGADPSGFVVTNRCPAFVVENRCPVVAKADHFVAVNKKVAAPGYHVHRDSSGREWSHTDASRGDRAAHLSPFDGSGPYWTPAETGVRIVQVPAAVKQSLTVDPLPFALPQSSSTCPPGGCPSASPSYFTPRPLARLLGR